MPEDLSAHAAAAQLGVFTSTVIRWINADLLPGSYKLNPAATNSPYRIPQAAIDAFRDRRQSAIEVLDNG